MSTYAVQPLSNSDFIEGGLYPGGTGIAKEFKYKLWDYNGTQAPNSNVAVFVEFHPTDGSNEGKVEEIYWNVGPATNFVPDQTGGMLLPVSRPGKEPTKGISANCNWKQVFDALTKSCGLDPAKLNGPTGILVLQGSELTLTRMDQKERENMQDNAPANAPGQPVAGGKKPFKRTILIPTRVKYAWEMRGGATSTHVAHVPHVPQAVNTTASTVANVPATGNGSNGNMEHSAVLMATLTTILSAAADVGVPFADIARQMTESLTAQGVSGKVRAQMMKNVKAWDVGYVVSLATANGWTWDETENTLYA